MVHPELCPAPLSASCLHHINWDISFPPCFGWNIWPRSVSELLVVIKQLWQVCWKSSRTRQEAVHVRQRVVLSGLMFQDVTCLPPTVPGSFLFLLSLCGRLVKPAHELQLMPTDHKHTVHTYKYLRLGCFGAAVFNTWPLFPEAL